MLSADVAFEQSAKPFNSRFFRLGLDTFFPELVEPQMFRVFKESGNERGKRPIVRLGLELFLHKQCKVVDPFTLLYRRERIVIDVTECNDRFTQERRLPTNRPRDRRYETCVLYDGVRIVIRMYEPYVRYLF